MNQMLLRRGFTNLYFGETIVMDSPSQVIPVAQIKHFTASKNPNGQAQGKKNYTDCPFPLFYLEGKKKKKEKKVGNFFLR
jgi:hypothetical protein